MNLTTYDLELITEKCNSFTYDYFILAPNVEQRSKAAYFTLKMNSSTNIKKIIAADYESFHINCTPEQEQSILSGFPAKDLIVLNAKDDSDLLIQLSTTGIDSKSIVGIDITGFSIPAIYKVMRFLNNRLHIKELDVYYAEPKHYIYKEAYFDSYHIKTENRRCLPVAGYLNSGNNTKEVLTIFLGFDSGLADQVYGNLFEEGQEIIRAIVVNGFPSYTAKLKDISLYNNDSLITKLPYEDDLKTVTANNPFDSYNLLCKIKMEHPDILLNICTIGCKPMALGACLFALDNMENTKVTYPKYKKTKFDADEEPGKIWRYGVSFA